MNSQWRVLFIWGGAFTNMEISQSIFLSNVVVLFYGNFDLFHEFWIVIRKLDVYKRATAEWMIDWNEMNKGV